MEKEEIEAQFPFKGGARWMELDQGREREVAGEGCCAGPACCQARAQ